MNLRLLVCSFVGLIAVAFAAARAESPAGSICFILDCSKSMSEPAEEDPEAVRQVSTSEPPTRFEVADRLLRSMLRELAAEPRSRVNVWLYGHRVVWEADVKHPDLLSQDDYLEATVGFAALNGLLPGDDVEQVLPFKPFTLEENQQLIVKLNTLKPWGEKPLYLAMTRALDALADQPAAEPKTLIVLTDGGNEQWLAKHKTSRERVVASLKQNLVPIHIIHLGPKPGEDDNPSVERELGDLAEQGGGSMTHVASNCELTVAQVLSNSRKVAQGETRTGDDEQSDSPSAPARPADLTITGSVVYFGKPVSSGTITLEGTDIPSVNVDRQGRFLIRKVPAGRKYRLAVKAIAKNHAREKVFELNLAADSEEQPFLSIDLK